MVIFRNEKHSKDKCISVHFRNYHDPYCGISIAYRYRPAIYSHLKHTHSYNFQRSADTMAWLCACRYGDWI